MDPEGLCSRAADSPQDPGARQRWALLVRGSHEVICTPCVTPVEIMWSRTCMAQGCMLQLDR